MTDSTASTGPSGLRFNKEIKIPTPWGYLAAKTWGPDDGMPVLALHGWMDNAGSFDNLAPLLPSNIFLVCLDFCGHGLSSGYPPGIFLNYYDHVYHVKIVIDYFKWEKVPIIGHSMGAMVGIYFAAIFPELTEKLVSLDAIKQLSATARFIPSRMNNVIKKFQHVVNRMKMEPHTYTYQEAREKMIDGWGGSVSDTEADVLLKRSLIKKGEDKYQYSWDLRTTIRPYLFTDFSTEQLKEFGRSIRCPFLLIKAKDAPLFEPKEMYLEFLDIYQNSSADFRYVQVEGRHHVHLANPKVVLPHIVDFLCPNQYVKSKL